MNNNLIVHGKRWFYKIKGKNYSPSDDRQDHHQTTTTFGDFQSSRGLCDVITKDELMSKLVICMMNNKGVRLYSYFEDYLGFAMYLKKFSVEQRSFYEVILGSNSQKPHFDLDLKYKDIPDDIKSLISDKSPENILDVVGSVMKNYLIKAIIEVMKDVGVNLTLEKDILIYTSHSSEKRSYHIIINNYYHHNNLEAKEFYTRTVTYLTNLTAMNDLDKAMLLFILERGCIDKAVYSPCQQFRILGCQKIGSGRPKKFCSTFSYFSDQITHKYIRTPEDDIDLQILQLEESLITFTSTAYMLPSFTDELNNKNIIQYGVDDISRELADRCIQALAEYAQISLNSTRFPYKFLDIKGSLILLKRLRASKCRSCNRLHENENPYLIVVPEKDDDSTTISEDDIAELYGADVLEYINDASNKPEIMTVEDKTEYVVIYFHCRRAPLNKKLRVGRIPLHVAKLPTQEEIIIAGEAIPRLSKLCKQETKPIKKNIQRNRCDSVHTSAMFKRAGRNIMVNPTPNKYKIKVY